LVQKALLLPENQLPNQTRAFLIERYMYTMTLGHITMGSESDEWVLNDAATLSPMIQTQPGSGGVHELFMLIPIVSVTARQLATEQSHGRVSENTLSDHRRLFLSIQSWQPYSDDAIHNLCGKLYQQALLVYLASTDDTKTEESSIYSSHVQEAFDTFISILEPIPPESTISTTLCWPLAIFGSCARSTEHRRFIRERLDLLSRVYSAQSVRDTKILLEKMWEENSGMASPLSFEYMMKREGTTVLFF
jgi:hypothetical protein